MKTELVSILVYLQLFHGFVSKFNFLTLTRVFGILQNLECKNVTQLLCNRKFHKVMAWFMQQKPQKLQNGEPQVGSQVYCTFCLLSLFSSIQHAVNKMHLQKRFLGEQNAQKRYLHCFMFWKRDCCIIYDQVSKTLGLWLQLTSFVILSFRNKGISKHLLSFTLKLLLCAFI